MRRLRACLVPALLGLTAVAAPPLRGQETAGGAARAPTGDPPPAIAQGVDLANDDPKVLSVAFEGVKSVDQEDLRHTLATIPTRCRTIFYKPICLFSNSPTVKEEHHVDPTQLRRDVLRIRVFYFQRGYRDTDASASVTPQGDGVKVTFTVEEGPPTVVTATTVRQTDSVLAPSAVKSVGLPRQGDRLDLIRLDSARLKLRDQLWDKAYADASVQDTTRVDDAANTATVEVTVVPGRRTTIDTVDVRGNESVSDATIRRILDLGEGDLYKRTGVLAAERRLYGSELFRQVFVHVPDQPDSAKRVVVEVREAPPRAVKLGAGFNTVAFGQVEANYTLYNWVGGGRRLDLRATVGNLGAPQLYGKSIFGSAVPNGVTGGVEAGYLSPTWQGSAQVTQPGFLGNRNTLSLGLFGQRRSVPGIVIEKGYGATASFTRRLADGFPASLSYSFEETSVDAGGVYFCANFGVCRQPTIALLSERRKLSPLILSGHIDRTDDALEPTRGWVADLSAEHASAFTFSDFHYNRIEANGARYFHLGRGTLATRIRVGGVRPLRSTSVAAGQEGAGNGPVLHPRKRFYAGGASSVRGYAENQLGPRILTIAPSFLLAGDSTTAGTCTAAQIALGTCDPSAVASSHFQPRPLGGNSVLEGSVEYRWPVMAHILVALFVDAARVGPPGGGLDVGSHAAVTPGFGVRYLSPVGPIRIDLGIRPQITETLPVITQVTGTDGVRRLVRLDTPKRYDPVGAAGGGFRGFLSRLQLHLAIGEAF